MAVAKDAGFTVEFHPTIGADIAAGLQAKMFDASVGVQFTQINRDLGLDFSDPIWLNTEWPAVKKTDTTPYKSFDDFKGEVVATDGRQLLVHRGFTFPWKEDVLLPRLPVFGHRDMALSGPVAIGRTDKDVAVRVGPWTFVLAIDATSRSPPVDRVVPAEAGVTSRLQLHPADAADLLELLRNHWRIENCLHYVRDVTLGEDACRVRKGTAPQVLAALRNAVVHLLAQVPADSRPEAIELLQIHPERARELIGIPQSD